MSDFVNGEPSPDDSQEEQPTQVQPTQQQPVTPAAQQPAAQPVQPQAAEQPAQQADTQPTQQQPRVQTPPIPGAYASAAAGAATGAASGSATGASTGAAAGTAPQPSQPTPPDFTPATPKSHRTAKAVAAGLLGGVLGAAALTCVLLGTGVIKTGTTQLSSGTSQNITIDPSDEDTTTANAVAAKALQSVVSVYCTYADGTGMGSGVIYDTKGNIITNNHVIEDAQSITVTINGKSYDATLVGTDASSDVAVIKADLGGDSVTPIEVGDSSELQVGDWVMSVGSPFGLDSSVSQGIVSALYRNTLMQGSSGNTLYTNLIQVDASINPGNSGGALVDSEGKLIGICTLYSSDTESFAGIGFAIPGNYATEVADKIIAGEMVTHAYIGVSMQTVNARNAASNNLSVNYGAYVVEVTDGSPADEAGIQEGDVIIGIDGTEITSADGAILAVRSHEIGETVPVTLMRGDQEVTVNVTFGSDEALQQQQQEQQEQQNQQNQNQQNQDQNTLGDNVDDLMEQFQDWLQQYQNQREDGRGGRGLN